MHFGVLLSVDEEETMIRQLVEELMDHQEDKEKKRPYHKTKRVSQKIRFLKRPRVLHACKRLEIIRGMYGTIGCTTRLVKPSVLARKLLVRANTLVQFLRKYVANGG